MFSIRNIFTRSASTSVTVKARGVKVDDIREGTPVDRQSIIPGFDQDALHQAWIGLVGGGGINSEIALGLVRKGVGGLVILDDDIVTMSNLSRQRFFQQDLYKPKAHCLARNLARECVAPTTLTGHNLRFEEALLRGIPMNGIDVWIFGVDNNEARAAGCREFIGKTPAIFLGTGPTANNGYVAVQEPEGPCFACIMPQAMSGGRRLACAPSSVDLLKPIAGLALYAIDTFLMGRPRKWHYREVFMDGSIPDRTLRLERDPQCPECGAP